jgi:aromatic-L-amino-acid decarboxylase
MADYLAGVGDYPVLPPLKPGEIRQALPTEPPEEGEPVDRILDDYKRLIEPGLTHWNHPGFFAYFSITGSGPGVLGEALAAALNVNAMLWRTGPAATELEETVCDWLRRLVGLPASFTGHINDTASIATLLALAAARQSLGDLEIRRRGMAGRRDLPALTVYASDQAHSSVDKAALTLGVGIDNVRRVASDDEFRLDPPPPPPASIPWRLSPPSAGSAASGSTWTPPMPGRPPSVPSSAPSSPAGKKPIPSS